MSTSRRSDPLAGWIPASSRVLVLGLRTSGTAVASVLASRGASVTASDLGTVDPGTRSSLEGLGVDVEEGGHTRAREALGAVDFVFASPGISPTRGFLSEVCASGVPVVSEIELAVRLTDAPVVAVTGTNGKTTVCRLAESIGRRAGLDVHACGNLETKFITAAAEHPDADAFVVEASSFSLAFCSTFHPRVAVITSLAPDHLDWHGTFEHYREAKAQIAGRQEPGELYLYPADQPELEAFAPAAGPLRAPFGDGPFETGAWTEEDSVVVGLPGIHVRAPGVGGIAARGRHFAADAAAAAAAMAAVGAGAEAMTDAFGSFSFDAHRLEPVGTLRGVAFVNDSVATNPHATLAALRSFDVPIVLIAGGRNKGIDLSPLRTAAPRLRAVIAIGEASAEVRGVFDGTDVFVPIAASMSEAVAMAIERSASGDVVLLSPACASHDMFTNYAERGDAFRAACVQAGVTA